MKLQQAKRQEHLELGNVYDDRSSEYPTMTVPDEAMTIPYLLARYVKGLPVNVQKTGVDIPTDDFDAIDWEKAKDFDLTEHDDLRDQLQEIEEAHKEQVKKRKAQKEKPVDTSSPNTPPKAGTAEPRADRHAGDGAAAAAE